MNNASQNLSKLSVDLFKKLRYEECLDYKRDFVIITHDNPNNIGVQNQKKTSHQDITVA